MSLGLKIYPQVPITGRSRAHSFASCLACFHWSSARDTWPRSAHPKPCPTATTNADAAATARLCRKQKSADTLSLSPSRLCPTRPLLLDITQFDLIGFDQDRWRPPKLPHTNTNTNLLANLTHASQSGRRQMSIHILCWQSNLDAAHACCCAC